MWQLNKLPESLMILSLSCWTWKTQYIFYAIRHLHDMTGIKECGNGVVLHPWSVETSIFPQQRYPLKISLFAVETTCFSSTAGFSHRDLQIWLKSIKNSSHP